MALTIDWSILPGHAHFFNQLSTGLDVVGIAGEWLTAISNTNM
jgi:glutamate decarboxylase